MYLWRVDYRARTLTTLGTVAAMDERAAIKKAAELFHISFANRTKLVVTRIDTENAARNSSHFVT